MLAPARLLDVPVPQRGERRPDRRRGRTIDDTPNVQPQHVGLRLRLGIGRQDALDGQHLACCLIRHALHNVGELPQTVAVRASRTPGQPPACQRRALHYYQLQRLLLPAAAPRAGRLPAR